MGWQAKRVLITGASGFIGQHLQRLLQAQGAAVYGSRSPTDDPAKGHPLAFDIRDAGAVKEVLDDIRPEVVFHLAAVGVTNPGVDPRQALAVNAGGVINLLEALKGSDVERVVLVGTSYEYGASGAARELDPINAYGASKVAAWAFGRMYWRAHKVPIVIVRPFQVYGPGQPSHTLIPAAVRAALSGADFPMTPGEQERDFTFVEDVAEGMMAAAETAGIEGASLDLGTGEGIAVRRAVEMIWDLAEAEGTIRPGALPYRTGAPVHLVADADHTAALIDWRATTPLEEGLQTTIAPFTSEERHSV